MHEPLSGPSRHPGIKPVRIFLLGPPEVLVNGAPLEVDTRKAVALLAYLVLAPRLHSRDAIAGLLWPEADEPRARGALRRTLTALRNGLGEGWLTTDRERVGLTTSSALWLDVDRYEQLIADTQRHGHPVDTVCPACVGPLSEAASLYRDDFLRGFRLRDSPEFEQWQLTQGEALRATQSRLLERLTIARGAQGDLGAAIQTARRWLEIDPLNEAAYRQLMVLYDWSGDRSRAIRQYEECVAVLDRELGVEPLEETTRLHEAIVEQRLPYPPAGKRATVVADLQPRPSPSEPYPMVGREEALRSLVVALADQPGKGLVVTIEGEAGIGKSRLVEELGRELTEKAVTTLHLRAHRGDTHLAFGVAIAMVRAGLAQATRSQRLEAIPRWALVEISRLVPDIRDTMKELAIPPPLAEPGAKARLFDSVVALLERVGASRVLVVIDDAHWLDDATLELLSHLVARIEQTPISLVLTWRPEHVAAGDPLRQLVAEAAGLGRIHQVELARLDRSDVRALVEATHPEDSPELADRIHKRAEGVPFLVVSYLELHDQGRDLSELPNDVGQLLQSRLATLTDDSLTLLATASVVGRSFDLDLVTATAGLDEDVAVRAAEELVAAGLISEVAVPEGAVLDFSHEILQETAYRQMSSGRRRLLHRRVADGLAARAIGTWDLAPHASAIAAHYEAGGRPAEAAEYYRLAGEQARSLASPHEAATHLAKAIALGHPEASHLRETMADLCVLAGNYGAALDAFQLLESGDAEDAARIAWKVADVYERLGSWELAQRHLTEADRILESTGDTAKRALVAARRAHLAHRAGAGDEARARAEEALSLAEESGDPTSLAQAHNVLGVVTRDRPRLAREHLRESLRIAETLEDRSATVAALNNLALTYLDGLDREQARPLLERALELNARDGDRHREAALRNNLADLHRTEGDREAAMRELKRAATLFAEVGTPSGAWEAEIWKLREW